MFHRFHVAEKRVDSQVKNNSIITNNNNNEDQNEF